ncbi:MAG TPA: UDP-N-acetylmuramoyl-L-alanine--D-glutamate ligase [Firmicutes bacterium]|jgi:UDP-N-acetylmuramoylalanine--D-glutamate ligase|nr:UDP-N-acetylmuramoyl-L-alanine--D-glutamate ligase [Bacillota bacterium]
MNNGLKEKIVLVLGLAGSGRAAIHLLLKAGATRVIANDRRDEEELREVISEFRPFPQVSFAAGGHGEALLENVDLIIKSPGIHPQMELLQKATGKGIKIYSEIELAHLFFGGKLVGITGTNGKTTTTSLVGEIYKGHYGERIHVAGNIGRPLSEAVLHARKGDIIIAELSSFQLENVDRFSPDIAAILNLAPDHLDYHGTMEGYISAKKRILMNQRPDDWAILNWDDPMVREFASFSKGKVLYFSRREKLPSGVCLHGEQIVISDGGSSSVVCRADEVRIRGLHNLENALAATAMAWAGGIGLSQIAAVLRVFPGVAHRLESVCDFGGIRFVNDSKGTNPQAALSALRSIPGPKILIAGGSDKGSDFNDFVRALRDEGVVKMILIGETAGSISRAASAVGFDNTVIVEGMSAAVEEATASAKSGDTVLLSPACASWDMFKNFEERGNVFKEAVLALKERYIR